jgi:hypothetical protein
MISRALSFVHSYERASVFRWARASGACRGPRISMAFATRMLIGDARLRAYSALCKGAHRSRASNVLSHRKRSEQMMRARRNDETHCGPIDISWGSRWLGGAELIDEKTGEVVAALATTLPSDRALSCVSSDLRCVIHRRAAHRGRS